MELKGKSFLKLLDFTSEEIGYLLDLAAQLKQEKREPAHENEIAQTIAQLRRALKQCADQNKKLEDQNQRLKTENSAKEKDFVKKKVFRDMTSDVKNSLREYGIGKISTAQGS